MQKLLFSILVTLSLTINPSKSDAMIVSGALMGAGNPVGAIVLYTGVGIFSVGVLEEVSLCLINTNQCDNLMLAGGIFMGGFPILGVGLILEENSELSNSSATIVKTMVHNHYSEEDISLVASELEALDANKKKITIKIKNNWALEKKVRQLQQEIFNATNVEISRLTANMLL